jgi:hypothetical protein
MSTQANDPIEPSKERIPVDSGCDPPGLSSASANGESGDVEAPLGASTETPHDEESKNPMNASDTASVVTDGASIPDEMQERIYPHPYPPTEHNCNNHREHNHHSAAYHASAIDGKAFGASRQHHMHVSSNDDYLQKKLERLNAVNLSREESLQLRTHGIGIIVSPWGGIGVREKHEFPTEDEKCLNRMFLAGRNEAELAEKQRRVQKYRSETGGSFPGLARFVTPPPESPMSGGATNSGKSQAVQGAITVENEEEFDFGISGLVDAAYLLQNDEAETYRGIFM